MKGSRRSVVVKMILVSNNTNPFTEREIMPQPPKEPLTHLNRAHHRIRQACEELHAFRTKMPREITEQRNSMFREDLKSLAAYDAADVVCHLLQYARRQINLIKAMGNPDKKSKNE